MKQASQRIESDKVTDMPGAGDLSSANVTYSKRSMSQAFYRGDDEEYGEEEYDDSEDQDGDNFENTGDIDLLDRESLVNLGGSKAQKYQRTFHARQINKRGSKEPVGLNDQMLAGCPGSSRTSNNRNQKYARIKRERRISELNLSVDDSHPNPQANAPQKLPRSRSEDSF